MFNFIWTHSSLIHEMSLNSVAADRQFLYFIIEYLHYQSPSLIHYWHLFDNTTNRLYGFQWQVWQLRNRVANSKFENNVWKVMEWTQKINDEFISGNIQPYLHFVSFHKPEMMQLIKIFPTGWQGLVYPAYLIPCMTSDGLVMHRFKASAGRLS